MAQQAPNYLFGPNEYFAEYPELMDYDTREYKSHLVKKENHIVTLTFNRPQVKNAHDHAWEFIRILDCVKADKDANCLVVTGVGDAFHAGANIKGWSARQEGDRKVYEKDRSEMGGLGMGSYPMMRFMRDLHKPTIAMVNGAARGMGVDLALCCDLIVASEKATFGTAYILQGLTPADGSMWYITQRCGYGVAMDLCLTARVVDAQEALRLNLVNRVVPHDELAKVTYELADLIANKRSPMAVRLARNTIYQATTQSLLDNLDTGHSASVWTSTSPYSREAMKAWVEKRQPNFNNI
jgi:2-(1,2-epoxy-1,2-dihydrophenyl)acetyl-CoA isomerase